MHVVHAHDEMQLKPCSNETKAATLYLPQHCVCACCWAAAGTHMHIHACMPHLQLPGALCTQAFRGCCRHALLHVAWHAQGLARTEP